MTNRHPNTVAVITGGTQGMGLAIARLSVQAVEGSLDLVAWSPEDTRFRLFIPLTTRTS